MFSPPVFSPTPLSNPSFFSSHTSFCTCHPYFQRSLYNDFAIKYAKDERLKGIEKTREKEALFADFLVELRHKEKEQSRALKEKVCARACGCAFVFCVCVFLCVYVCVCFCVCLCVCECVHGSVSICIGVHMFS